MTDRTITWGSITLGGTSNYLITDLAGWDEMPGLNDMSVSRVRAHGDHMGDQFSQARIVTVSGNIVDPNNRDGLAQALLAATTVSSSTTPLTIDVFGQQLTANARIVRRAITAGPTYGAGAVPFALQWRCPDPLRYGPVRTYPSVGLPTTSGGLAYPLAYPLAYGAAGANGQVTLTNDGTADASFSFTVTGSLPNGFEVSGGGGRITYPVAVPSGQTVSVDTGAGTVFVEGTADRRASLTNADWLQVPAGGALTLQFTSLGGTYDPAALFTPTIKSASW